jgi:transcriptional regulator with XRE-family HTH domain
MNPYRIEKLPGDVLQETALKHRHLRKQLKLTQAELAERSGVSLGSIKRFERTGKVSFEALLKLAHILGRLADFESLLKPRSDLTEVEKLLSDKTRR